MALIANLRHYLGDDLSLIKIPGPAAALREFLCCVVEAVTSRDPDDINYVTQLKCRKGSGGCDGDIIAFFDQDNPSVIKCLDTCPRYFLRTVRAISFIVPSPARGGRGWLPALRLAPGGRIFAFGALLHFCLSVYVLLLIPDSQIGHY